MKYIFILLFVVNGLFANEYYAKLNPIESYTIKASVSGKVIYTNENIEGKKANDSKIIEIDSFVDKIDLKQSKIKLKAISEMLEIEKANYERMLKVSSKSGFEKDAQKLKAINYQVTKADIEVKIANLEDSLKNKKLVEKNRYIYNIAVKEGDYVTPGTLLYEAKDLTKGKLEIFVPISEIENIKNKTIYLNDKKSDLKPSKIYEVADSTHISSYKVEILIPNPEIFSRLIKIEFK